MNIKLVDLNRQYKRHKKEFDEAISKVIEKSAFIGNLNNPFVKSFESSFAKFIGTKHCIACANGTDAIEILLQAMGIGAGDEVIVPALTWIATSEAVTNVGAKPVFVDIEEHYFCMNPDRVEAKISDRTKAIIPVHLYGQPADMPAIMDIAERHDLLVLEDCAQAHGAKFEGKTVGTFGHAASFSFFPGKNLGAFGDAGGMLTDDPEIASGARMIAQHGQSNQKHMHLIEGRNSRLDGIQAAILDVKLKYLSQWTDLRIAHAGTYAQLLDAAQCILPLVRKGAKHVFHLHVVRAEDRSNLMKYLKDRGIATAIQYPRALPFLDAYKSCGFTDSDFPVASRVQHEILSLPMFPELNDDEIKKVAHAVLEFERAHVSK